MIAATRYVRLRFPPQTHGIAAVLTYATVVALSARAWPGVVPLLLGGLTFVSLFVFLRLVDDLDDGAADAAGLRAGMVAVAAAVVLLNLHDLPALALAGGACAAALAAPFLPRHGIKHPVVLFVAYEVAPLLVLGYGGVTAGAPPMVAVGAAVVLWSAYEYWKFTRKLDEPDYRPFGLGLGARLVAAVALSAAGVVAAAVVAAPWVVPVVVGLIAVAFAAGMASWWRAGRRGRAWWSGLTYVLAVDLAVLILCATWGVWG
ncbi:hypothetical protein [Lentzea flaviverrucosa]|uniref:Uncharacterized protein n=1 Tax=Lentzea flaviverrucosa TaxID=200379 RepID=A0A1H9HHF5_9PSEU|nr:hypothetical protein [Lentzea flaviverrucosa]RDI34587.1 hypothetical protein DFR72_101336 [Lentzea flaviverrucosa]SEQ61783.1 hypothetical protein SAMN05216195_102881 [Lentzea flaviverrucosa]